MSESGWEPAPHACRVCGGRILKRGPTFWCGGCGATSANTASPICGCGIKLHGKPAFHCTENPAPTGALPHLIVIMRGPPPPRARP